MLEIKDISYGYTRQSNVFDSFSLTFSTGGVTGLLGLNGTGKSTLLYLIMGLLRPRTGCVLMDGTDTRLREPATMADMFIVPEEYDLPSVHLRDYVAAVRPFYPRFSDTLLSECLDGFAMPADIHLGTLSMGQKKKVYMAVALATGTRLLVMDEPTNGLDIPAKSQFRKVVARSVDEDKTVIVSTHQVRDVETLLDAVCVIGPNRVLLQAPMDAVSARLRWGESPTLPEDVIFSEPSVRGFSYLAPNTTGADSAVNLELLFNALMTVPDDVARQFADTAAAPR